MPQQLTETQHSKLKELDQTLGAVLHNEGGAYGHWGFKSVHDELDDVPVTIVGTLPTDLEGIYIRNGTNPQFNPMGARYQMFDGPGMLHQVHLKNGKATYSNSYVRTKRFQYEREVGREVYMTMGEMLTGGQAALDKWEWLKTQFSEGALEDLKFFGTGNGTAIQFHSGRLYTFNEAGYPFVLNTRAKDERLIIDGSGHHENWNGRLPGPFSAHPAIDPASGDMYSVATNRYDGSITIVQISKGELVRALSYQQAPNHMAWIHECCITDNYIIFADISMRVDREGLRCEGGSMYYFDPDYKMRFGVLPRDFDQNTDIKWISTDAPGVIWHLVNAWEERQADGSNNIILFAPRFADYPAHVPIHTPEETHSYLTKWIIDPVEGKILEDRVLLPWGYERNSFNVGMRGKPNRFCYLLDEQRDGYMGKGALKYDYIEERELKYVSYGHSYGGEPLFIPKEGAVAEDDGYVFDLLMQQDKAEVLVLDAKTMDEVCRLQLPRRVPFGVHAVWLDETKVAQLQSAQTRATSSAA